MKKYIFACLLLLTFVSCKKDSFTLEDLRGGWYDVVRGEDRTNFDTNYDVLFVCGEGIKEPNVINACSRNMFCNYNCDIDVENQKITITGIHHQENYFIGDEGNKYIGMNIFESFDGTTLKLKVPFLGEYRKMDPKKIRKRR